MLKTTKKICVDSVVGEGRAQVYTDETFTLEHPATELLEPIVNVVFDRFVPLRNKVLVQGRILKNVIYKAEDGNVKHEPEVIQFPPTEIEMPGFTPGIIHNGRLLPNGNTFKPFVEEIFVDQTLTSPTTVQQKVVVRFSLKVCRQEQLCVPIKCGQVFHFDSKISCSC